MTLALKNAASNVIAVTKKYVKPDHTHLPRVNQFDPEVNGTQLMRTLTRALTTKRGYGGIGEAEFVAWLSCRLPVTMIDGAGNLHIDTRTDAALQRTLLTAHTDTVHHKEGDNFIRIDGESDPGQIIWRADGDALGADDGAGVALIHHLIVSGFKGYSILFRGEECGGIGSKWLADTMPELLRQFDRAIAFDRAGYYDVITSQAGGICASGEFAQALSDQLNTAMPDFFYCPDSTGVYTDTAEFIGLIPECTNLSVGYKQQHGDQEWQNITFLKQLATALTSIDWEALPVTRKPQARYAASSRSDLSLFSTTTWDDEGFEDTQTYNQACEQTLEAIEMALDGNTRRLTEMMCGEAAVMYTLTMLEAESYVRPRRLTTDVLNQAYDDLCNGDQLDRVLIDLYDESVK